MSEITEQQKTVIEEFKFFCWELCLKYHGSETSGFRSDAHNESPSVGGAEGSKHTYAGGWGLADDLLFDDVSGKLAAISEVGARRSEGYRYNLYTDKGRRLLVHVQRFPVGVTPEDYFAD